jgi:hypothetical protein
MSSDVSTCQKMYNMYEYMEVGKENQLSVILFYNHLCLTAKHLQTWRQIVLLSFLNLWKKKWSLEYHVYITLFYLKAYVQFADIYDGRYEFHVITNCPHS